MRATRSVPEIMPTLSAGRHLSPRRGACFMEFASYLAGERWSDHPACTDPVLAALARGVNDLVSDDRRDDLVADVPRVVGLRADDALGMLVALRASVAALPVASMDRQRALAVALRIGTAELDRLGVLRPALRADAEDALRQAPDARRWADDHVARFDVRADQFARHGAAAAVRLAVLGIAEACVFDADDRLIDVLRAAIDDAEEHVGRRGDAAMPGVAMPVAADPAAASAVLARA